MHEEIRDKIDYMIDKNTDKAVDFMMKMYKQDPETIERMLDMPFDIDHIPNRKKYEELVEKLRWTDGGRGAKWSFEDIKRLSKIDFSNVDYTEFDYAYLVNMLYAKCHKYITDPSIYLKLAKSFLEDDDEETKIYQGAYAKKHKHQSHGEQSYYNDYDEESRRRRRYRSERMDDEPYTDRYTDRRTNMRHDGDFFRQ